MNLYQRIRFALRFKANRRYVVKMRTPGGNLLGCLAGFSTSSLWYDKRHDGYLLPFEEARAYRDARERSRVHNNVRYYIIRVK